MSLTSWIGGLFDENDQSNANSANAVINATLAPGSAFQNSGTVTTGTPGTVANSIATGAANIGAQNIGVNTQAMQADQGALSNLSNVYYNNAINGGPAGAAALEAARANIANAGAGGHSLGAAITNASLSNTMNAANADNQERAQNFAGSSQTGYAAAQNKLNQTLLAATASHANHERALGAQAIQNSLGNMQTSYDAQLAQAAQNIRAGQVSTTSALQSQDFTNTMGVLTAAASGLGSAGSSLASQLTTAAQPTATPSTGSYTMPTVATGSTAAGTTTTPTTSDYSTGVSKLATNTANPYDVTAEGDTSMPDKSAWGDWLGGTYLTG